MSSNGKPYSLYKRNRVYYCRFKLPNNRWSTAKSTGETTKSKAERWAFNYLSAGQIVKKENLTLEEFSKDFFSWEGSWATDKRVRGLRISRRQCHNLTYLLKSQLLPYMGSLRLTDITRAAIKDYRNNLCNKGYAGNTINKALSALRSILESAEENAFIQFVPKIDRAAINPKQKGILTIEEVKKIFSIEWRSEARHCHPSKDQFMGYAGNLLASSTGLRLGEIQGLVLSDIYLQEGYINVRRSWDKLYGLNSTTKTGRSRNIFIPNAIKSVLLKLIEMNPAPDNPESFLFFSEKTPGKPVEPTIFIKSLYTAMNKIGISEKERRERNITFHSWRHWFNSLLVNAKIPLHKIQSMTGHLTSEMTQLYYHPDDMGDVVGVVQNTLFSTLPAKAGEMN